MTLSSACFLAFCGYMPSTHPMNQTGNYSQGSEAGDLLRVNASEIEMLVEVPAVDVVKDCKIYTSKSSANENEKAKAIADFAEQYGAKYIAVQLKTGRYVYARATIEDFMRAFTYKQAHPECLSLDLDELPKDT